VFEGRLKNNSVMLGNWGRASRQGKSPEIHFGGGIGFHRSISNEERRTRKVGWENGNERFCLGLLVKWGHRKFKD
jgi:hypothetical protein